MGLAIVDGFGSSGDLTSGCCLELIGEGEDVTTRVGGKVSANILASGETSRADQETAHKMSTILKSSFTKARF